MSGLGDAPVVAFVSTADMARTRSFYGEVLGLPLSDESPFALVFDAGGTMLRVTAVEEVAKAQYTVLGWRVDASQADSYRSTASRRCAGVACLLP